MSRNVDAAAHRHDFAVSLYGRQPGRPEWLLVLVGHQPVPTLDQMRAPVGCPWGESRCPRLDQRGNHRCNVALTLQKVEGRSTFRVPGVDGGPCLD